MGERCDARREPGPWRPVADQSARRRPARARARAADPRDGGAPPGLGASAAARARTSSTSARTWSAGRGWPSAASAARACSCASPRSSSPTARCTCDNLRSARQLDTYVLAGEADEVFEPRFTFHGFRYVEVTGIDEFELTGSVVHSDTPRTGWFECSDELVNQLWRNINWGQRGNFLSVPTDCPQRDERLGWLADAQVFLPTASLNMDVAAFMTKWGDDILDAQLPDGAFPDVAPRLVVEREGAPAWGDAGVIVPWTLWRRYGDRRLLERHWPAMERYMAYLLRHNPDLLWTARRGNDYGDWLSVGEQTPREVLATAYWAYDALLMAEMADALGLPRSRRALPSPARGDLRRLQRGVRRRRRLHRRRHADRLPARAAHGPAARGGCDRAPRSVWSRTSARNGGHLTTGFVGVGLLCPDAQRVRLRRRRPRAADQGHVPVLGLLDPPRRDHDLGALGRLDRGPRVPDPGDELVQPLLARVDRAVALRVRRRASAPPSPATSTSSSRPSPARSNGPARPTAPCAARSRARGARTRTRSRSRSRSRPTSRRPSSCPTARRTRSAPGRRSFSAPRDGRGSERELVRARPSAQL